MLAQSRNRTVGGDWMSRSSRRSNVYFLERGLAIESYQRASVQDNVIMQTAPIVKAVEILASLVVDACAERIYLQTL